MSTLLVTGASGQLGRRVVELLLEKVPAASIIATTRTPEKLADFKQKGVTVRPADFDDPASLATAFKGADRLLLISTDVLGEDDRRLKQHQNAVKAAEASGVKHVVYTSGTNPEPGSPIAVAPDHYGTEVALAASNLGWTALRNNIYTDFQLAGLNRAVQSGQLINASGTGKVGYVTREDCAQAAAAALASDFSGRRTLDITGPEAVSQADLAKIAASVTGREVTYIPVPLEALIDGMVGAGVPRPFAEIYASFDAGTATGKLEVVSNAFEELTGRKPTRVADFIAAHKEALLAAEPAH